MALGGRKALRVSGLCLRTTRGFTERKDFSSRRGAVLSTSRKKFVYELSRMKQMCRGSELNRFLHHHCLDSDFFQTPQVELSGAEIRQSFDMHKLIGTWFPQCRQIRLGELSNAFFQFIFWHSVYNY